VGARWLEVRLEQVGGLLLEEPAGHFGRQLQVNLVAPLFDGVHGNLLLVVALRALAGDHAVLPGVPGTHDELAANPAFGQRAPAMIADVGDRPETTFMKEHGDSMALDLYREGNAGE